MKKIQFRYDGSDEAKKCIEWVNEENNKNLGGWNRYYYTNGGRFSTYHLPHYTLLTPTEFLREVTGEWMPTVGEVYEFNDCGDLKKGIFKIQIGKYYILDVNGIPYTTTAMQKYYTVEENIQGYIQTYHNTYIPSDGIQKIIEMVKGGEER